MNSFTHTYLSIYRSYVVVILFLIHTQGCEDKNDTQKSVISNNIELYMDSETDESGKYYLVDYNGSSSNGYTKVHYITLQDLTRVFWTSVDTFCVQLYNEKICDMIVNYSTYSRKYDDGTFRGSQMIYLKQDFIGDTLSVVGCIDYETCDELRFILQNK